MGGCARSGNQRRVITPEQVRQALENERRPYRSHDARIRDALEHIRLSKEKPANLAGTRGPFDTENNRRPHYGNNET